MNDNPHLSAIIDDLVDDTDEVGIQVAAVRNGRVIASVSGGAADQETGLAVTADTLFPVFSVTKALVTAVALTRRIGPTLDLTAPLASYWPEFAANGKSDVNLTHVLTHTAGLPSMPADTSIEQMSDAAWMAGALARSAPEWPAGERMGYHAYTWGFLVAEAIARQLVGEPPISQLLTRELAVPLRADVRLGISGPDTERIATVYRDLPPPDPTTAIGRAIPPALITDQSVFGRADVRASGHPGAGGFATAVGVATVLSALADAATGATDGVSAEEASAEEVYADELVRDAVEVHRRGEDVVTGQMLSRGLGFYVSDPDNPEQAPPFDASSRAFGHPGAGGSVAWADLDTGTGFAILHNRMSAEGWAAPAIQLLVQALRDQTMTKETT